MGDGVNQAELYLKQGKLEEAIAIYQQVLRQSPHSVAVIKRLGIAFQLKGELDQAHYWYQKALEIQPDDAEIYTNLGSLYAQQQRWERALAAYQKALDYNPNLAIVYRNLAQVLTELNQTEKAIQCQYQAFQLEPQNVTPQEYFRLGKSFQEAGKLEDALGCYEQTIKRNPDFYLAHYQFGEVLSQQGQDEKAILAYQTAIQLNPNFLWSYNRLAEILTKLERWKEAVLAYQAAIQLNPDFSWSHHELATILKRLNRWEEAIEAYRVAIKLNKNFGWSYYHLGECLMQLQRWEEAIQALKKSIEIQPAFNWAYYYLGQALIQVQRWEEVVSCYNTLMQSDFDIDKIYPDLAQALIHLERLEDLINLYKRIIHLNPEKSELYTKLGALLIKLDRWQEALHVYDQAIQLKGDSCWDCYYLIELFTKLQAEEQEQVIHYCKDTIQQSPNPSWFYYLLAEALRSQQKWDEAIQAYYQAIHYNPTHVFYYLQLGDFLTQLNRVSEATQIYRLGSYYNVANRYPEYYRNETVTQGRTLPHFLIIGSSKCGTTSLYHYMTQHPQILPALKKEIDFWMGNFKKGIDWYSAHFPPLPNSKNFLTGEASPHYLDLRETAERVFKVCPDIKLIIILRNPVYRFVSHYHHWIRQGWENRSLDAVIDDELGYIETLLNNPICGSWHSSVNYIARGVYIKFIQQWMEVFPKEQFLVLKFETLAKNPQYILNSVFLFLDIPAYEQSNYIPQNKGDYPEISSKIYDRMYEFYQPYNHQLENFLGINFNW